MASKKQPLPFLTQRQQAAMSAPVLREANSGPNPEAERGLHAHLDQNPTDWDTRLILSDLLEEKGDTVGAEFQRLLARHQRAPRTGDRPEWVWNVGTPDLRRRSVGVDTHSNILPWHVWNSPQVGGNLQLYNHPTRQAAEQALMETHHQLKQHGMSALEEPGDPYGSSRPRRNRPETQDTDLDFSL